MQRQVSILRLRGGSPSRTSAALRIPGIDGANTTVDAEVNTRVNLESTVSMRVIRAMVLALEQTGVARSTFLSAASLSDDELNTTEARISRGEAYRLAEVALRCSANPAFALHWAERLNESSYLPVSNVLYHSRTLREALEQLRRFARLISDEVRYDILEEDGTLIIRTVPQTCEPLGLFRFMSEMTLTGFLMQVRRINRFAKPLRVDFEYAAPPHRAEYARVFGGVEHFEQRHTQIVFDAGLLNERYVFHDQAMHAALESMAEESLFRETQALPWSLRVREVLVNQAWPRRIGMPQVAAALELSVRSLRRRLAAEETTFSEVYNDAACIVAKRLLHDRRLNIDGVCDAMGFSDKSTFYRSFKRWTGMTPKAYRTLEGGRHDDPDEPTPR